MVEHGEEKIAHGRGLEAAELAGRERAAVAGEDEGEVMVGVAVAVGVAAAIGDHRVVQHGGAVGVLGGLDFFKEPGELRGVELVDERDFFSRAKSEALGTQACAGKLCFVAGWQAARKQP